MSFLTALHVLNIMAIMGLIFYIRHIQGSKPYSLFWSVLFFLFCLSSTGMRWFLSHPLYLLRQIMFLGLIILNIILIGRLMENNIFYLPSFMLMLSPLAWGFVLWCNHVYHDRQKEI